MSTSLFIELNDLRFFARHGYFKQEREVGNEFRVDLKVLLETELDSETDDITGTVSYVELYEVIRQEMSKSSKLLETVAIRISNRIKSEFKNIIKGKLRIEKCSVPIDGFIGHAAIAIEF